MQKLTPQFLWKAESLHLSWNQNHCAKAVNQWTEGTIMDFPLQCHQSHAGSPIWVPLWSQLGNGWQRLARIGPFRPSAPSAKRRDLQRRYPSFLRCLGHLQCQWFAFKPWNEQMRVRTVRTCEFSQACFVRVISFSWGCQVWRSKNHASSSQKTGAKTVSSETTIIHCDQCSAWCAAFLDSCGLWFINRGSGTIPCISELALERWLPWQLWHCKERTGFAIWLHLVDPSGLRWTSVHQKSHQSLPSTWQPAQPIQLKVGLWNCCEYGYHWYHLSLVGAFFAFRTSTSPSCWMPYESSEPTATGGRCGRSSEPTATQPVVFCDEKTESEKKHIYPNLWSQRDKRPWVKMVENSRVGPNFRWNDKQQQSPTGVREFLIVSPCVSEGSTSNIWNDQIQR